MIIQIPILILLLYAQKIENVYYLKFIIVGAVDHGCPYVNISLSHIGKIIDEYINNYHKHYHNVNIDKYIIMPNHIHLLITISVGQPWSTAPTLSTIISTFKTLITKELGFSIWQRNYYEHIIRNEKEYYLIYEYIENNPLNWEKDSNYFLF